METSQKKMQLPLLLLIATTLFTSSFLLFTIQPLVGKIILPYFGGTAGVWSVCLLFFQSMLLIGYLYSHLLLTYLSEKAQTLVHFTLVCSGLYFIPLDLGNLTFISDGNNPTLLILEILSTITLPFIVLTANTSIFQSLYSKTNTNFSPYTFYAVSNIGCLFGLLSYALFTAPTFDLHFQKSLWSWAYWGVTGLILISTLAVILTKDKKPQSGFNETKDDVSIQSKVRWALESAVPTALLCAITTYLSSHVASTPLLWVIPLCIYLLSIAIPFGPKMISDKFLFLDKSWPKLAMLSVVLYVIGPQASPALVFTVQLIAFFAICLGLHTQIFRSKPKTDKLTEFYLFIALGGVIGSLFASILAPAIFTSYFELPILLVVARVLFRTFGASVKRKKGMNLKVELITLVSVYMFVYGWISSAFGTILPSYLLFGVPIFGIVMLKKPKRVMLNLVVGILAYTHVQWNDSILYQGRSFYSPLIVKMSNNGEYHELVNGSIVHGRQATDMRFAQTPLSYYDPSGGAGILFKDHGKDWKSIAGIGLGVGALSGYLASGQKMDFFEIDPLVINIAENSDYFTFISDARLRGAKIDLIKGDARITLEKSAQMYDAIFVDAFQSSAIPTHLLTEEAFNIYETKLNEGGMIIFHISNHFINFESLIATQAETIGFNGLIYRYSGNETGGDPSIWAVLVKDKTVFDAIQYSKWKSLSSSRNISKWTDAHSNLLEL